MKLLVYEVLEKARKARSKAKKVEILKEHRSGALQDVLRGTYDDAIVWLLPKGDVPYEPNKEGSIPSNLLTKCTSFAYLVKGGKLSGDDGLSRTKRERIFLEILSAIHPKDAEVCVNMINKKPIPGVTKNVVKEAFPNLILK